jgi:hypothetical protein
LERSVGFISVPLSKLSSDNYPEAGV